MGTPKNIPIHEFTDEQILAEIVERGGNTVTSELYKRYSTKIFRRCISLVKDQATAEDLTHDIFMKILLNISSFRGKSKVSTWIYAITYNFCIDHLRKTKKARFQLNDYKNYEGELVEFQEDLGELRQIKVDRLKKILEQLHIEEKMILLMKYQENFSIKQIQDILEISESATKMRIKRAKEKVRKLYQKMFNGF